MNQRRTLLRALGAGALAVPLAPFAQQAAVPAKAAGKVWRVGMLLLQDRLDPQSSGAFVPAMRELGYVEGQNLLIEWRFADGDSGRLPGLATDLLRWNPDVLVGGGTASPRAMQKLTTTIPIVMVSTSDPVGVGLVKSLARPGGNITGMTSISIELIPKRLQLLLAMVPKVKRVAFLRNPDGASAPMALATAQGGAQKLGLDLLPIDARTVAEIDTGFAEMREQKAEALLVVLTPLFQQRKNQIAALSAQYRLPSMTADRLYADAGCLMSYGSSSAGHWARAATFVDKLFKGRKPAELPVEQPTRFELVINLIAAKALGITVPQVLLLQAERVIE